MATRKLELKGQKFTRLEIVEEVGRYHGAVLWKCQCDCGKVLNVPASALRRGGTKSCGCYRQDWQRDKRMTHGQTGSTRYDMLKGAKRRSREAGLPFAITIHDIPEIPKLCPILGMPLVCRAGFNSTMSSSPTLDRIIPSRGYVPGNIQIISHRANVIKNDASADEVMKVALFMAGIEQ